VTLGLQATAGPSAGTITYTWEQIEEASFGSDRAGTTFTDTVSGGTDDCSSGALSSSDPSFVTLSGDTTVIVTFTDAARRESLAGPTFTAPEVAATA